MNSHQPRPVSQTRKVNPVKTEPTVQAPRGQVLVIVALGLVVMIALVGVIIDGGYAWGKQRETQNGADAAAKAGAVVLASNLAGTDPALGDADVLAAVNAAGGANGVGNPDAYYTDFTGEFINAAGTVVADRADAAKVGDLLIPPGAYGVRAFATQTFDTFLARVIGFDEFTTTTSATARAGYNAESCDSDAGCFVLPITVPVTVLGCDGSNNPVLDPDGTEWSPTLDPVIIPLCMAGPGNVGWLDWTPTAGGTSELRDAVIDPSNPALSWPGWYYVTSTGNVNSAQVETALNAYAGEYVQFPQFDGTCDDTPTNATLDGCPEGHDGGNGSNQCYHLASMGTFQFCGPTVPQCAAVGLTQGAYMSGSNPICGTVGNPGWTSCLAGRFQTLLKDGTVSAAPGPGGDTANVGVQLIH